ncbi:SDR family NAD(P)-dependent oxidoreductase [Parapedobacter indicus]|uniref:Glucose 1-dehydrogenase n=1 Tax=Parapedobacter indicus TaxID=1477437 RepID=A0A1I3KNR1_9SPHI|nr:glucose 1-dehydrogenase [Parapedobacter indicus]PPL01877.1 glucose 1-dehydrogenase [Parapedobacter indicus]SFI74142.1 glucose 1-dehydrogenase [Parapedobacter indicus]
MDRLKGKVALITGSDSGIGQAIAFAYGAEGAKVVVTYHSDEEGGKRTAADIQAKGSEALCLYLDVSDENRVATAFEEIIRRYGQIDILVNNAGVNGSNMPVAEMDTDTFDRCLKTNLYGPFFCCREYLRRRADKTSEGTIIFISSIHETVNTAGNADYNASKAGLKNFSRSLALELADKNIRVNNIAPGMILTAMNQEAVENKEVRKEKEQHIPMKRAGTPEDVANVAVFLASSDSGYVTGSTYTVDGGLMIQLGQGA